MSGYVADFSNGPCCFEDEFGGAANLSDTATGPRGDIL